jgi:hypothetical protein
MSGDTRTGGETVFGVGINDATYITQRNESYYTEDGKRHNRTIWKCPYYVKWKEMIRRAYSSKYHEKKPTYIGCSVCDEWIYFSQFKAWVDRQPDKEWASKRLDKDLLLWNNKHYSPETCVFITEKTNSFLTDRAATRGEYMIGVCNPKRKYKATKPFCASCGNPFKREDAYIGYYSTELEAHLAWKKKKHKYSCLLAELEVDPRVKEILNVMYRGDEPYVEK